jgi:hypothetical protein
MAQAGNGSWVEKEPETLAGENGFPQERIDDADGLIADVASSILG